MKEKILEFLRKNYSEDRVSEMIDEEIYSGNWLDEGWQDDFDDEYDAYQECGRGEAEGAVRNDIVSDVEKSLSITSDKCFEETGAHICEIIESEFEILDK